jgi:hypothetical protein
MHLDCRNNKLKELKNLPNTLVYLDCSNNKLTELKNLPNTLQALECGNNQLTSLTNLVCSNQIIKSNNLIYFISYLIKLIYYFFNPNISSKLCYLNCSNNQLTKLEKLPSELIHLDCGNNQLKELNNLPNTITCLICSNNYLKRLRKLPNEINILQCEGNKLVFTELNKILKLNRFMKFNSKYIIFNFIFYTFIKKRCSKYKEELISKVFHPSRIFKYLNDYDDLDTFIENI